VVAGLAAAWCHEPVNSDLSEEGRAVLAFLASLTDGDRDGIVCGQNLGISGDANGKFDRFIGALHTQSGKWPGMACVELDHYKVTSADELSGAMDVFIDYYHNKKGLVTINWAPMSPSGGPAFSYWDGDLTSLTTNSVWIAGLDRIAAALAKLRDAGVPVLWRPLQENNGPSFWWATGNGHSFESWIALYRHLFDYYVRTKGLDNLIWVYSPVGANSWKHWPFPGIDVVDVVAPTTYNMDLDLYGACQDAIDFSQGKPIGVAEFGPATSYTEGNFDNRLYVSRFKERYPKMSYWVSWSDWSNVTVSLAANDNVSAVLNDPYVICAPVPLSGVTAVSAAAPLAVVPVHCSGMRPMLLNGRNVSASPAPCLGNYFYPAPRQGSVMR